MHSLYGGNYSADGDKRIGFGTGSLKRELAKPRVSRVQGSSDRVGARSSAGEHYVDIVGVTGSIPVVPTIS